MSGIETNYALAAIRPSFPAVAGQTSYSPTVAIIGGGFCGLSAALELGRKGYKVVLIEADKIGSGASGNSGGHICYGFQRDISLIEELVGKEKTAQLFSYTVDGINYLQNLVEENGIDCDLRMGYIEIGGAHAQSDMRRHLGSQSAYRDLHAHVTDVQETASYLTTGHDHAGVYSGGMGQLEPYAFILGLARKAVEAGVIILENTKVESVTQLAGKPVITTQNGMIVSPQVVICAAGCTAANILGLTQDLKQRSLNIRTTLLVTAPLDDGLLKQMMPGGRIPFADINDADVSYGRIDARNRLIFGCGESIVNPDISYVINRLYGIIPLLKKNAAVEKAAHWSGGLSITANFIPHVGQASLNPHILFAQGLGGIGIVWGARLGKTLALACQGLVEGKSALLEELALFKGINHVRLPRFMPQRFLPRLGMVLTKKPKLYKKAIELLN